MKESIKVLLVEDEPGDAFLIEEMLSEDTSCRFELDLAVNLKQAVETLSDWKGDIILLDLGLPDSKGLESLEVLTNLKLDIPILVITGLSDDQVGRAAITIGAQNYLVKGKFDSFSLIRAIWYSIERNAHIRKIKESERKLEENNKLLEKANIEKSKLLSIISHDLRSPFNSIIGLLDLVYTDFDDISKEEKKKFIVLCLESAKNTYQLIENLLDWARTQTREIIVNPQPYNLKKLVDDILKNLVQAAKNKNIAVTNLVEEKTLLFIDEDTLSIVVRNLISNAIKFTPRNGKVDIKVVKLEDGAATVCVEDSGVGFSKENLSKIFDVGEIITTPGTEYEKGTGLGLILCKELIKKNKGTLWIESCENSGTRVFFTVPVFVQDEKGSKEQAIPQFELKSPEQTKVLLVEDEDTIGMYVKTVLNSDSLQVLHAVNGIEAIEMVKNNPDIKLILMDIRMPLMNGLEASRQIRKLFPHIPIVAQTAYARDEYANGKTENNFDEFIMKPLNKEQLFSVVEKYASAKTPV